MPDWMMKILGHKLVTVILAALVVFGLLKVTGLTFSFQVGEGGITAGITSATRS